MSRRSCVSLPHVEAVTLMAWDLPYEATLPRPGLCIGCAPHHPLGPCIGRIPHLTVIGETSTRHEEVATFTHSIKTRVNAVKFTHQSLCNPKILTLLKAVRRGFLKGCPNISKKLILKYLNPSPATAKGHMMRPRHGIRSTTPKATPLGSRPYMYQPSQSFCNQLQVYEMVQNKCQGRFQSKYLNITHNASQTQIWLILNKMIKLKKTDLSVANKTSSLR
jgi:hypothetical protein